MKIEEIWNTQDSSNTEIALSAKRHKKSANLVNKITKRLRLERSTTYLAGPVLLIFAFVQEVYFLSAVVTLYIFGLIMYYNYILRRIESTDVEDSVMKYLKHTLYVLRWFRIHYLILGLVSFVLGFALTAQITEIASMFQTEWILAIVVAMIGTPLITFYIHFEPHLKKIRRTVSGLEETNLQSV